MTPEESWIYSGFLEKESKGENWNKRFFVLDESSLKYYKRKPNPEDPDLEQCRGEIRIKKICSIQHSTGCLGKDWCFEIRMSSGPSILLVASSHDEMEDWMDNILTHPLFNPTRRESMEDSNSKTPARTGGTGYTTKVVGGVVIRTQIPSSEEGVRTSHFLVDWNDSTAAAASLSVSTPAVCVESAPSGIGVMSSGSQSSIATWTSAPGTSPTWRPHRRDGGKVIQAGYCVKQGGRRRTWKRRYFLLDPFGLAYYRYQKDKDPIRNVPLPRIVSVGECNSFDDRAHVLQVMTVGRIFYMQCESSEDCQQWIEAIQSVTPPQPVGGEGTVTADGKCTVRSNSFGARAVSSVMPRKGSDSDNPLDGRRGSTRSNSIGASTSGLAASCGNKGRQLWRLSMGRCHDYLQPTSDDSDDDFDSPMNSPMNCSQGSGLLDRQGSPSPRPRTSLQLRAFAHQSPSTRSR